MEKWNKEISNGATDCFLTFFELGTRPRLFFYLVPKLPYFVFDQLSAVGFEEVVKYNNLETRDEKKCLGPGLCPVAVPINFAPSLRTDFCSFF